MCRILGIKHFSFIKHKEVIDNFLKLAETGMVPEGSSPGHYDGWGIGYYKDSTAIINKSGGSILKSKKKLFNLLKEISSTGILILHMRKSAWPGTSDRRNAQPFKYKNYLFGHNGTILAYKKLLKNIDVALKIPKNPLDTEVFFYYMLSFTGLAVGDAFKKAVLSIKKNYKYTALNSIFSDGRNIFAYREYSRQPEYYTLYSAKSGRSTIICSEAVSKRVKWRLLRKDELFIA